MREEVVGQAILTNGTLGKEGERDTKRKSLNRAA